MFAKIVDQGFEAKVDYVGFLEGKEGNRLMAVALSAPEESLPRTHEARGFRLHVSLGYEQRLPPGHVEAVQALCGRWLGRPHRFRVHHFGCGGTAQLHPEDQLVSDPNFQFLSRCGLIGCAAPSLC